MRVACLVAVLLLAGPAGAEDKIDIQTLKYPGLGKLIRDAKGKVVVVDVWYNS